MFETEGGRRFDLPEGLTPEEERAALMALERYFVEDDPRRFAREPWHGQWVEFARKGVPPMNGRADVR